jgi:putative salt-induced outer membrane protein
MRMWNWGWVALGAALMVCAEAQAQSAWATYGSLGVILSRGITNTDSGNTKLAAARELGRWVYSASVAGNYASTNAIATTEDERARLGVNLTLSKRTFWFGGALYDRNRFDGFAYQESAASGMGRLLIESKSNKLSTELGAGYLREEPEALTYNAFGEVTSRKPEIAMGEPVVHVGAQFSHVFSSNAKVLNTMLIESGATNTMSTDDLSVQVKVHKHLSLSFGVDVTNNTNPPPGQVRHTLTMTTMNLIYSFSSSKNVSAAHPLPALLQGLDMP